MITDRLPSLLRCLLSWFASLLCPLLPPFEGLLLSRWRRSRCLCWFFSRRFRRCGRCGLPQEAWTCSRGRTLWLVWFVFFCVAYKLSFFLSKFLPSIFFILQRLCLRPFILLAFFLRILHFSSHSSLLLPSCPLVAIARFRAVIIVIRAVHYLLLLHRQFFWRLKGTPPPSAAKAHGRRRWSRDSGWLLRCSGRPDLRGLPPEPAVGASAGGCCTARPGARCLPDLPRAGSLPCGASLWQLGLVAVALPGVRGDHCFSGRHRVQRLALRGRWLARWRRSWCRDGSRHRFTISR